MGPGCAFYFLLVLYTIVAGVLDIFCAAVAWLIARIFKVRFKWLVVLFAALTPSLFLGSEFVLGMIASSYVSATKGVDLGFGDCLYAPLTKSYELIAGDLPEKAHINIPGEFSCSLDKGVVQQLWVSDDSIVVTCSNENTYSLVVFYPQEDRGDVILQQVDSLQLVDALKQRNLEQSAAMSPNGYFNKKQAEAHSVEEPIRHTISILLPLGLWVLLFLYMKKRPALPNK